MAAVREVAERLRMGDQRRAHAAKIETVAGAEREAAAWKAVPWLLDLAEKETERREAKQLLACAQSEQAPLREAVEHTGAELYAKLEDGLARLVAESDQNRAALETAAAEAQAGEREYEEAAAATGRAESLAASAEAARKEEKAKLTAARRTGLLRKQEDPTAALARLVHEEEAATEQTEQARRQVEEAREQATAIAAERVSCADRLSTARQRHDQAWDQWNALAQDRRDLSADLRLRELAGIGEVAGELDLDGVGADLVAMLTNQLVTADAQLAAERAQAFEDERLRDGLDRDGFCPPPREVEQAVTALREQGAPAVTGVQFLRETVPAHQHDAVIAAIPHLIGGVVICGPVPGGDLAALARRAAVAVPTVISLSTDEQASALLSEPPGDIAVLPLRPSVLDAEAGEEELERVNARLATVEERCTAIVQRREADRVLCGQLRNHLDAFDARKRAGLEELLGQLDEEVNTLTERRSVLVRQAADAEDAGRRAEHRLAQYTTALRALAAALPQVQSLVETARAVEHWASQRLHAQAEAREHRMATQACKDRWQNAQEQERGAQAALRQCQDRAERWKGWTQEIRQELSDEALEAARPAAVPEGSVQALRERWTQARRDWLNGISDTALQQRLTTAETAIKHLNQKLAAAGSEARAQATELLDQAETMDAEHLAARIAVADRTLKDAERAEAEAGLLLRQVTKDHQEAATALDDFPGAKVPAFDSTQEAQEQLQSARQLLEQDQTLAQVRHLDAEKIHRRADQAASHAAQLRQSVSALSAASDHPAPGQGAEGAPDLTVDALLLEQHGLSAVTAQSLQPHDAEQIKDALVREVTQADRALERARTALRKDVQKVERLAQHPDYVQIVDGRLRERLQQDLTTPTRLATLLEDIEERERQVVALLAESAEDQARVVDACTSTVEAVLDSVEEVAGHSRLPK